jgi:hypothetical protein
MRKGKDPKPDLDPYLGLIYPDLGGTVAGSESPTLAFWVNFKLVKLSFSIIILKVPFHFFLLSMAKMPKIKIKNSPLGFLLDRKKKNLEGIYFSVKNCSLSKDQTLSNFII